MFYNVQNLVNESQKKGLKISELMLEQQQSEMQTSSSEIYDKMKDSFDIMRRSIKDGLSPELKSHSGLAGGDAYKVKKNIDSKDSICGSVFTKSIAYALAVTEYNACMGRIIAAPTAGSCGVLPAVIVAVMEEKNISEKDTVMALFNASAFGMVIATNANTAGAEGGCQAECGSASAMAAAAIVEMMGGSPDMCANAVAIALKCILGLVCDPVAGLVEVPCIKRNASCATNALTAAEMALSGVESVIPADEVIIAMKKIGDSISPALKETSEGGLAVTPTGKKIKRRLISAKD